MASIALHATQLVFQGALCAAAAKVGLEFYYYIKDPKTPEQKLNVWAFILIAECVVGAALGVSASALLVGAALHTLMLLKARDSFFLSQGHIKVNNFPYLLSVINEKTPTGVLGIKPFNVRNANPEYHRNISEVPCVSAFIFCGEKKISVDFEVNANGTLSTRNNPKLQLSFTFNEKTKQTKIKASDEALIQLAIKASYFAHEPSFEICLIHQRQEVQGGVDAQLFGQILYTRKHPTGGFKSFLWERLDSPPAKKDSDFNAVQLFSVPDENKGIVCFLVNETIFEVPFYKFQDNLYLQDVWGIWILVKKDGKTSDLSSESEQLTLRLGLSALCLLDQLPHDNPLAKRRQSEGTITHSSDGDRSSMYELKVYLSKERKIALDPSSKAAPLLYTFTKNGGNSIHVKLIEKDGTLIVDPTDYAHLCAFC